MSALVAHCTTRFSLHYSKHSKKFSDLELIWENLNSWSTRCFAYGLLDPLVADCEEKVGCCTMQNILLLFTTCPKNNQHCEVAGELNFTHWVNWENETCTLFIISAICKSGLLDGKAPHRFQCKSDLELKTCGLNPDAMKYIGERSGRELISFRTLMWKYYAQLTWFSLRCSITWLHEDHFALLFGLWKWVSRELDCKLCHKKTYVAGVTPAPAVSRVIRGGEKAFPAEGMLTVFEPSRGSFGILTCITLSPAETAALG